ncbi:MAG: ubiquinol-cytochrome c reductase iron-sulfur subunit [Sneathiella sp.]|jgi:ubiquinol-cytochrome c reductase iron-sulfur subunit|uniref:ubiquinol-cytochrome c reductase iron-sulfur subunit n=1 Tax=Sneathiella sp. TaxID=1964365 RepID=UPI000C48F689|nr:ubiquinol-cytochrome c reductase iron-sulfur subunit [Sneathiella sp.]MAZ04307.1 ubiquinol-cytochrome c reductase iron-sulfur subunit [Sneathiella sp.]|tara:strand:- start:13933 stop:14460 length:528 start_codon:yes stop_codon:yes gene_type:complete
MTTTTPVEEDGVKRRDFLYIAAGGLGAVGTAAAIWPFVSQMNPSADVLALSTTEVDLEGIETGSEVTVVWQGKPVFVRHRTEEDIARAEDVDLADLPDPVPDADRVIKPEWLIMVGICTHLGCVPLKGQGDYGGWFCPCHGSHYDTSGRIRKGPAPANLVIPPYEFLDDNNIKIG